MTFTTHGHQIRGTTVDTPVPVLVVRCGGPGMCPECSREAAALQSQIENETGKTEAGNLPLSYQDKARRLVFDYTQEHLHRSDKGTDGYGGQFSLENVFVVWFCKTLQNWKCLLSTTLLDGMYYEVTYDGDKKLAYLDAYKKFDSNTVEIDG